MKILKAFFLLLTLPLFIGLPFHVRNPTIENVYPTFEDIHDSEPVEVIILNQMSLEEKVGQLLIFGFYGTSLNADLQTFITQNTVGGLLILGRNITGESQLKKLITDTQSISEIPLFISIDQEGGTVARLGGNSLLTMPQSSMNTKEQAYDIALKRGKILKEYGINMNFAPVVEYVTQPTAFMIKRVFRGTKDDVVEKSNSAINGYTDSHIIPVPKHFPGHGDTPLDPHYKLPNVNIDADEWDSYIYTFKKVLENRNTKILMVGHIQFPNIDNNTSTVSTEIITKRLKEDLGYEGIVLTDDMNMGAINKQDSYPNIAKQALLAGNDILMYSKDINIQQSVYNTLIALVSSGEITTELLDEKVLKVLRLKIDMGIVDPTPFLNDSELE